MRGLAFFPLLETIESTLSCLKQAPLQAVQTLHQGRRVFIVGILGRVHGPAETANKSLVRNMGPLYS